jgi:hypothetical protein
MNGKWFSIAVLVVIATLLLLASSCARNQHLTSIQVVPATATFGGVGATLQFKAFGTYIHPPATKDVTALAKWSIDSQFLVSFNSTPGLVTSINDCGSGNVMASIQDGSNDVFGTAFVTSAGLGTSACTQAALTVIVVGSGTVTSSPTGINCPAAACAASFPLDSAVGLTASPGTGATLATWSWPSGTAGCQSESTTSCTVVLNTNQTITATFH